MTRRSFTGWSAITRGLGTLDREVFEAVAESPSALLDTTMPVLTRAADNARLWIAIGGALAAIAPFAYPGDGAIPLGVALDLVRWWR